MTETSLHPRQKRPHNNTGNNTLNNREPILKGEKKLWITPITDDRFGMLVVWLLSQRDVRQAILAAWPEMLPVIPY
jgi:hypothetical protein